MKSKPNDPLSGCCLLVVGSAVAIVVLLLLFNGCQSPNIPVNRLAGRLSSVFAGILFWAVAFLLLAAKGK